MKWIRYSKYTGEDLGIEAEDLLKALADFYSKADLIRSTCHSASGTSTRLRI